MCVGVGRSVAFEMVMVRSDLMVPLSVNLNSRMRSHLGADIAS